MNLRGGHLLRTLAYVGGCWVDADCGATVGVTNPATGAKLGTVPDLGAAETRRAMAYAASFIEWFAEEGKRLYGELIPKHQADKRIVVLRQPGCSGNSPQAMSREKLAA